MEPIKHNTRNGKSVLDVNTDEVNMMDGYLEDGDMGFVENDEDLMATQERRIESLKRAIDVAKLMSNVSVDDVIEIAKTLDEYIKDYEL